MMPQITAAKETRVLQNILGRQRKSLSRGQQRFFYVQNIIMWHSHIDGRVTEGPTHFCLQRRGIGREVGASRQLCY